MKKRKDTQLTCSFCSKVQKDVIFFVEGDNAYICDECVKKANKIKREKTSLSKLTVGLECGGSDGFSGISANPTLGATMDK